MESFSFGSPTNKGKLTSEAIFATLLHGLRVIFHLFSSFFSTTMLCNHINKPRLAHIQILNTGYIWDRTLNAECWELRVESWASNGDQWKRLALLFCFYYTAIQCSKENLDGKTKLHACSHDYHYNHCDYYYCYCYWPIRSSGATREKGKMQNKLSQKSIGLAERKRERENEIEKSWEFGLKLQFSWN